jgi:hypothetical protein
LLPWLLGLSWVVNAAGSTLPAGAHYPASASSSTGDNQGHVLAADGPHLVVGSPYADNGAGLVKVHNASTGGVLHLLSNPSPAPHDQFGAAVAIAGNLVAIGCPGESGTAAQAGCVHLFDLSSPTPTQVIRTLAAPGSPADLQFGRSVAIHGNRVVVGAYNSDVGTPGAAFVFDLAGTTPETPLHVLDNPGGIDGDGFGGAVAISGDRVAVSACRRHSGAYASGAVHLYQLAGPSPQTPVLTIPAVNPAEHGYFGIAIDLDGARLVVGASNDDSAAADAGSVYSFDLSGGGSAVLEHGFAPPGSAGRTNFGQSVALSGNWIVAGMPAAGDAYTGSGGAVAFDLSAPIPTNPAVVMTSPAADCCFGLGESVAAGNGKLMVGATRAGPARDYLGRAYLYNPTSPTPAEPFATASQSITVEETHFGIATAAEGNLVVVGAPYDDTAGQDSGAVFIYDWSAGPPSAPVMTLLSPEPAPYNHFGSSVDISGSLVVIGVPQNDTGASNSGRAYVFDLQGGAPTLVATLNNPSPAADDIFGGAVAIFGNRVLVGAHRDDTGKTNAGSAYLFNLLGTTPSIPVATLTNPDADAGDFFGAAVSISATRIAVGCPRESTADNEAGRVYLYSLPAAGPPVPLGFAQHPLPDSGDYFGGSIALSARYLAVGVFGDDTDLAGDTDEETGSRTGSAFVFDVSGTTATLVASLSSPGQFDNAGYGAAVAADGDRVMIGAVGPPPAALSPGVVYAYDMSAPVPANPVATLPNPETSGDSSFGAAVSIGGKRVVVGCPTSDVAGEKQGAAQVFEPFRAQIALELFGLPIAPNSTVDMGQAAIGFSKRYHLVVRNTGNDPLDISSLAWSGSGASHFTTLPSTTLVVPTLGGVTLPVEFSPSASPAVSAVLTLSSDSATLATFPLNFTGSGVLRETLYQSWTAAAGLSGDDAAPGAIPHGEGVENILKYAFNLDGSGPDLSQLEPATGLAGLPLFSFVTAAGQSHFRLEYLRRKGSGLSYLPKTSSSLAAGSFAPMGGVETVVDIDSTWERVIVMEPVNPALVKRRFGIVDVEFP